MNRITQLPPLDEIKSFFPNQSKPIVKVAILLIQCIMRARTVCLYKCRAEVGAILGEKKLKLHSVYTRFIRFFKIKSIDSFCIGITWLIIYLVGIHGNVCMAIDRSNWKIGKTNINILFIGLLLPNGLFIPVLWELLDKRGNSNEKERTAILSRFTKVWYNHTGIQVTLVADREFIGLKWFKFLAKELQWDFAIRLRYQDYLSYVAIALDKTTPKTEQYIERKVKRNEYFQSEIKIDDVTYYYTVFPNTAKRKNSKNKGDKFVILLSTFSDLKQIEERYRSRWSIEVYFFHCKTNGFNLEDLNFKNLLKAQLMMSLTAVAYVLCILHGMDCQKKEKTYFLNYNGKKSPSISLFRKGYDNFKNIIHTLKELILFIQDKLEVLPLGFNEKIRVIIKSV